MPLAAARAATALPRLPVEAQASVSIPSSAALAAATPTTRSLNEWVGLVWSSFSQTSRTPTSSASLGAGSSGPKQRRHTPLATAGYSDSQIRHLRLSTGIGPPTILSKMKFRRIDELSPYVFATVDQLKRDLRHEGRDVIDLGFGNPDIPSPGVAVSKLQEAAAKPANHRYSASRGITQLRLALTEHYERSFGVSLDPETQVTTTIGAKEGLAHLMWVLVGPGDTVVVPTPTYPIHRYAPILAGARIADFDVT